MAGASISHVLIVAGPSGAGKSAFLRELAAGRLPDDIARHLPDNAHNWREVYSNRHAEWWPLIDRDAGAERVAGLAVHYDVTLMWMHLDRALEHDPFWTMLQNCEAATVVNIRPTPKRLLKQWIFAHLGVTRMWAAHCKTFCTAAYARVLLGLHAAFHRHDWSLLRFVKNREEVLERRIRKFRWFHFYRGSGNVERMMHSWHSVATDKLGTLPVTHIEIAPHRKARIAKAPRWRVLKVARATRSLTAPVRPGTSAHSTVMATLGAIAAIC